MCQQYAQHIKSTWWKNVIFNIAELRFLHSFCVIKDDFQRASELWYFQRSKEIREPSIRKCLRVNDTYNRKQIYFTTLDSYSGYTT